MRTETVDLLSDKYALTDYLHARPQQWLFDLDAIDVSGAVFASPAWAAYVATLRRRDGMWRLLLLKPESEGARVRADESTVWKGNLTELSHAIVERGKRIVALGHDVGVDVEIRYYETTPVTRYVRIDHEVFESFYPADGTARHIPLARLARNSVLEGRVLKEFDVAWRAAAT